MDLEERHMALREEELRIARQEADRHEEQRQEELQQRREEARARKEADERRERLRSVQLPPPMTHRSDLKEYLELFESAARRKELPRDDWAPSVIPLLDDRLRGTAVKLPTEVKESYRELKKAPLEKDDQQMQNPAATFWTVTKERGVTALEFSQQLVRLLDRFMVGEDRAACLDSVARERFVQELLKEGQAFVRQKKPRSLLEATRIVEEYFHYKELSYTGWSSRTEGSVQEQVQSQKREKYHRCGWRRDLSPRQQRRDSPPHSDESRKEDKDKQTPPQESKDSPKPRGQQTGRGRGAPGGNTKCFACGEVGHRQASCPINQERSTR